VISPNRNPIVFVVCPTQIFLREFCATELNTVTHSQALIAMEDRTNIRQNKNLQLTWLPENPRVGGSIPPLA